MRPLVALLTDFGLRDHYVAAMKGAILGICPEATLVDVTHDIPPHDIVAAALELAACYRAFPPGTVFVAVVDPGVGSRRRAIAARASGYLFVAPDNGLLSPVLALDPSAAVVELTRPEYAAASISRTFEGRDRFAPAAAWLAQGVGFEALGDPVGDWVVLEMPIPSKEKNRVKGQVVRVDRFGNLVTNIAASAVDDRRAEGASRVTVTVSGQVCLPFVATYSDVAAGVLCALVGSTGHVEVSVNGGSAAERLGVARGARVTVEFQS